MAVEEARPGYTPETEVKFVKGVGPTVADKLAKLGIRTVQDLLFYVPKRHEDRTQFSKILLLRPNEPATVKGRMRGAENLKTRGGMNITRAYVDDGTGSVGLAFFNQPYLRDKLNKIKGEVIVYGMVQEGRFGLEFATPEWEELDPDGDSLAAGRLVPIYGLTEGIFQKRMRTIMHNAVTRLAGIIPDTLPASIRTHMKFKPLAWCLQQAHFPDSEENRVEARRRLVFEEFFYLQLMLALRRADTEAHAGIAFDIPADFVDYASSHLPFTLTGAQRRVVAEIFEDMRAPKPMNRLLQGDVGSGKTAVAACAIMASAKNGYQSALMAPTEILAEQHGRVLGELLAKADIEVELLIGRLTAKQKEKIRDRLAMGKSAVAVGTHALIQETVSFDRLGLVIIDEQHRFGVMQRAALIQKGVVSDVLVMTATPIPRTLTMALYGDLRLSVIDELPPGRRPVVTHWKHPSQRDTTYDGVRKLVEQGRQAYIVCPLVMESEKLQAQAAEKMYERLSTDIFPDLRVGLLHGQMKGEEKDVVMSAFRAGEVDILVATSVIEVGVDVANASVMVIEDANRFGLSQLHQLRGRVGRSSHQAFAILVAEATDETAAERMRIMTQTNDGFVIAEEDLRIRGPGEMYGTKQAGLPDFKFGDLVADRKILEQARDEAFQLVTKGNPKELEQAVKQLVRVRADWGLAEIS